MGPEDLKLNSYLDFYRTTHCPNEPETHNWIEFGPRDRFFFYFYFLSFPS